MKFYLSILLFLIVSPGANADNTVVKDKWEVADFSESFSGLQINGGLGYNWYSVSLDFNLSLRDAGDYEDFVNDILGDKISASAVTGMLLMSARF